MALATSPRRKLPPRRGSDISWNLRIKTQQATDRPSSKCETFSENPQCTYICSFTFKVPQNLLLFSQKIWQKWSSLLWDVSLVPVPFKACVRYFLSNFYFLIKWQPFKNYVFLFHRKSSFCSRDIQFFVILSLLSHTFQIQKGKWKWNIYDV